MIIPQQIRLSETDRNDLIARIEEDFNQARADHQARMDRFIRAYRLFRNRVLPQQPGDEGKSNYSDPLVMSQVLAKWARDMHALMGGDAKIVADPTEPMDTEACKKVSAFMSWRVLRNMKILEPLSVFDFRRVLFGRAHAYSPWRLDTWRSGGGSGAEKVKYEGPGFDPLWPDDLVVPAQDANTIHDFDWLIRKHRITVDALLKGEAEGRYVGVKRLAQKLREAALDHRQRSPQGDDEMKSENDEAEGVLYDNHDASRRVVTCWEWYGYWRPGKAKATAEDLHIVVQFVPDLREVVGVLDLAELYPDMAEPRPFVEASLLKHGGYWTMGYGEMLEAEQAELSATHNLFTDAGEKSVDPPLLASPASGISTDKPTPLLGGAINWVADPSQVKVLESGYNPQFCIIKDQAIRANVERKTGLTDYALGRASDRPNAPRTASGQLALMEEGNILNAFMMLFLRDDMGKILSHFWDLECSFAAEETFFRVTGHDSGSLLNVNRGFGSMTAEEFGGRFDFEVKFATSKWSEEAQKERQLALYNLSLNNPLILQNPKALYQVTRDTFESLGHPRFADLVPEPPDLDIPKTPREEWNLALQGDDIEVHALDNDELHLVDHRRRLVEAAQAKRVDEAAVNRMIRHIGEHQTQQQQKKLMQALAESMATNLARSAQMTPALGNMGGSMMPQVEGANEETEPQGPGDSLRPQPAGVGQSIPYAAGQPADGTADAGTEFAATQG